MATLTGLAPTRGLHRDRGERRLPRGLRWLVELAVVVALWAAALARVDRSAMTDTGLVSVLPWTGFAALAALAVSFGLALAHRETPGRLLTAYPALLTVLVYLAPPLVYGFPRYSWTWKHAGIVDYIDRSGAVDPDITVLNVYHNWPGFFAFNAMLTDLAGLDSALSYAAWAEVFLYALTVGAAMMLLRCLTGDSRTVAVGGWLFVLANWVGQGYFSPQGLNFVWYLVLLSVLLHWFSRRPPGIDTSAAGALPGLSGLLEASPAQRVSVMVLVLVLVGCIVSTHQLTPVMLVLMLSALVLARRTTATWLPVFAAVLLGAWVLYVATAFTGPTLVEVLEELGSLGGNLQGTLISYGGISDGQRLVSLLTRGQSVAICLLAGAGAVVAWRRGRREVTALLLAGVPVTLLGISAYGEEVLFRAYMFALPGLVYFAATLLWPAGAAPTRRRGMVVAATSLVLLVGFLFAEFGNDRQYHFSPGEVAAAEFVYGVAPQNSLLIEGSRNTPGQFDDYEKFTYVPISSEDADVRAAMVAEPTEELFRWMSDNRYAASYVLITRSQIAETAALDEMPGGGLASIEKELLASPAFRPLFHNDDAVVFVLDETVLDQRTQPGRP